MDSILNDVYNNLIGTLGATDKTALKSQQLAWLKKRNTFFKNQDKRFQNKYKKGEWGEDMEMITYDDKANFIKERVKALISK